jgi:hypothetical protein
MVSVADVENLSGTNWSALDKAQKQSLLDDAESEANTLYSAQVSTLPVIEGDRDVFVKNLAAHKWTLAEGGEASSEAAGDGNVNYNLGNPNENMMYLSQTRYGRTCIGHLDNRQQISIVRTY